MPLRLFNSATLQIVLAIVCGVLLGVLDPHLAIDMKPLSDGFIRVIGWLMPLMMFLLVSSGVAGLQTRRRGLVGKVFVYFQAMGLLSLCLGCIVTLTFNPGAHTALNHGAAVAHSEPFNAGFSWASVGAVVTHAFTQSLVMQVMLAGLVFGVLVGRAGGTGRGDALRAFLEKAVALLFRILRVILRFAPLAAFGAMAFSIGRFGPAAALPLFKFVAVMYLACGLFMVLVLATIARLAGARLWRLVLYIKDELLLVTFTGSSVAALPGLIDKMQKLGCDQQLVRLILTTGYTFNLSGSNIYLTTAVLFLAQMAGIELSAAELLTLLLISLLTSLGSTSMAGSAFLTLIATLNLLHLVPLESVGLLLGVERLMKCRSLTNVLGNCVACLAIARWQNALDRPVMSRALNPLA
ncbi:cation:dicarboxylate symporter family transporter [Pseudomonas sp. Pseusp122]|uniref:cation:dicarboxylate symporter family transporter n=1 Tax=unclassified Pseudomonas TaxID=196821 RepID=UPI0039A70394